MYLGLSRIANYFYFFYSPNVETKIADSDLDSDSDSDLFSFLHTELIQSQTNIKS